MTDEECRRLGEVAGTARRVRPDDLHAAQLNAQPRFGRVDSDGYGRRNGRRIVSSSADVILRKAICTSRSPAFTGRRTSQLSSAWFRFSRSAPLMRKPGSIWEMAGRGRGACAAGFAPRWPGPPARAPPPRCGAALPSRAGASRAGAALPSLAGGCDDRARSELSLRTACAAGAVLAGWARLVPVGEGGVTPGSVNNCTRSPSRLTSSRSCVRSKRNARSALSRRSHRPRPNGRQRPKGVGSSTVPQRVRRAPAIPARTTCRCRRDRANRRRVRRGAGEPRRATARRRRCCRSA